MKKKIIIPIIALIIVIAVILYFVLSGGDKVVSTITIDIKPSIEIQLNKNEKIINITALNEEGKLIINDDLEGESLETSLKTIARNIIDNDYINNDESVDILVHAEGKISNIKVKNLLILAFEAREITPNILTVDHISSGEKELAKEYDVTPSKITYINSILQKFDNIKLKDIVDKSIAELVVISKNGYHVNEGYNFESNNYKLKYSFKTFTNEDEMFIKNKNDLMNLYYNIINNGYDTYEFYCPTDYQDCTLDLQAMVSDREKLSIINNYVHPYNSFETVRTEFNSLGAVKVIIQKVYNEDKIQLLDQKVKEIADSVVKGETDPKKIIRLIHDYIINNTVYDRDRTEKGSKLYESNNAYGVLFQGYGICGGYTDAMALFLDYYNIPNFKIASKNLIWNVVFIDGKWYHLDLTWDDPITSSGINIIDYKYFLITSEELESLNDSQHNYDKSQYKELLNN